MACGLGSMFVGCHSDALREVFWTRLVHRAIVRLLLRLSSSLTLATEQNFPMALFTLSLLAGLPPVEIGLLLIAGPAAGSLILFWSF